MENDKHYQKFIKYKKKYDNLRKEHNDMDHEDNKKRIGCVLLHTIDNSDHILMVQDENKQWKFPFDYISSNKKLSSDEYSNELGNIFKKVTHMSIPEITNTQLFHNNSNEILTGKINHVDTNQFKSSDYAQNIGFIGLDMLKKHNYFPPKSVSISPKISDILQSMEDSGLL